jgi:hypothetical protein
MTRTIYEQTGWSRGPLPVSICNDGEVLERITEYSFDLNNREFVEYFTDRTGYDILRAGCGWDKKRALILDADDSVRAQLQSEADAKAKAKESRKFSSYNERWRRVERGMLQDCWELWCAGHR